MNPERTPAPNATGGITFGAVLGGAAALALIGGGVFAWQAYRGKKRREALQRAQAIRRKQQRVEPESVDERHPRTYRRDAPVGDQLEGNARPIPYGARGAGDEGEYQAPVTRMAKREELVDGTRQFRRPELPTRQPESQRPMPPEEKKQPEQDSAMPAVSGQVRRRRTERNHYDEDVN